MSYLAIRQESLVLDRWPAAFHGLRAIHVTDFHFRRWNRILARLRKILLETTYDLLLMTGDYCVQPKNWLQDTPMVHRLLAGVRPALGAFAILGNHDGPGIIPALEDVGVRVLRNESVTLRRGTDAITIAGIEQTHARTGDLAAALAPSADDGATILLAHFPSAVHNLPPGAVDLMLAGHTHAGQWRLPLWGCLWPNDHLAAEHAWGLHRVNGTHLHVSAGIGLSGPFFWRFNCPPEMTEFTLLAGPPADRP